MGMTERCRRWRTGRTNALKRSRARASGQSVEDRNDAAIHTPEVQWEEKSERP